MYDDDELVNMLCMGNFQTDYATKMFRAEQVCVMLLHLAVYHFHLDRT